MSGSDKKSGIAEDCAGEAEVSLGSLIMRVTVKTLIVFLVFFSLAAALTGCFFPKLYMEMYRSVGAYGKAASYAAAAAERERGGHAVDCDGRCDYTSLLTDGIGLAAIAYDDAPTRAHALSLYKFTDYYLSAPCHNAHSDIVDRKYIAAYGGGDFASLSMLYDYDDYVYGERTRALCLLGGEYYALASDGIKSELSSAGSHVIDMLIAYTDCNAETGGVKYCALADKESYIKACGIYFYYFEESAKADVTTDGKTDVAKAALKASLLRRISVLAGNLSEVENTFASYAGTYFKDMPELNELVSKDVFGAGETVRARRAYAEFIGSLSQK